MSKDSGHHQITLSNDTNTPQENDMIFKSLLRPLSTRSFPPRLCSQHIPQGHRKISLLPRIFHPPQPVEANGGGPPIRYTLTACMKSIFAAHAFYTYFYTVETGIGASMVPTISVKDDWFLINRSHRRGRNIRVGDIVMFDSVVVPGECAFKRVLGLEGDCVMIGTPGSGNDQMIRVSEM